MEEREKVSCEFAQSPEEARRIKEFIGRFTDVLVDLVEEKIGDLKTAAEQAGLSPTYFYRIRSGERTMSLGLVAKMLEMTGTSLETLARRLLEVQAAAGSELDPALPASPARLLEEWRKSGSEAPSAFLEKIAEPLARIAALEIGRLQKPPAWRAVLLVMEDERLRDWRKTRRRLERFSLSVARRVARQAYVSRGELVDLATLLAAWSALQRVAGRRGFAVDGLKVAFALAERSGDLWVQGYCLQKTAYLAHDLGRSAMALAMINKAALSFAEAGGADDLARNLIDRGYFSYHCGRQEDARRLLEAGLHKVDRNQRLYLTAAHLALARIYRKRNDLPRARAELKALRDAHMPDSIEAAYASWEAARQEMEFHEFANAEKLLREAFSGFSQHGRAGDLAFVALDLAVILLNEKRIRETQELVQDVLGCLGPMPPSSRALARPFENLSALLSFGSLGKAELTAAREQCRRLVLRLDSEG